MKRIAKCFFAIMCMVAIVVSTACTKEESGQNGGDNSGNENNGSSSFPFTLGYYHPEKKVKRVTYSLSEDGFYIVLCSYDFTWNGNNLSRITSKRQDFDHYSHEVYDEQNGYYTFTYNDLGYIHTIAYYDDGSFDIIDTVHYKKITDWGDTSYYVWIGLDYNDHSYNNWINRDYYRDLFFGFDTHGLLEVYNGKPVASDANGNVVLERDFYEHQYDNKKNPFMNLIFKQHDGGFTLDYAWQCALFVCPNNCVDEDGGIPLVYQYNGNYPSAISRKIDEYQEARWEIEYY